MAHRVYYIIFPQKSKGRCLDRFQLILLYRLKKKVFLSAYGAAATDSLQIFALYPRRFHPEIRTSILCEQALIRLCVSDNLYGKTFHFNFISDIFLSVEGKI